MTKTITWTKLPKRDRKHLQDNGISFKCQFEVQVEHMKKEIIKPPLEQFICWDCIQIAKKLGMWNGDE